MDGENGEKIKIVIRKAKGKEGDEEVESEDVEEEK